MTSPTPIQPARVWLRRSSLDRRLAEGADPYGSAELSRRARQLVSTRCRARLAAGLCRMVDAADRPRPLLTSQVPINRREILAERELFRELARDLRSSDALHPRGIALVERVLTDSRSPCYAPGDDGALGLALRQARAALHLA